MIGLYLHIPFCEKKCHYCNFVVTTSYSKKEQTEFLTAIEKEIGHHRDHFEDRDFETLYLGGGTPSVLSEGSLERLLSFLKKHFRFKPNAEMTCEVNPGDLGPAKVKLLKEFGMSRVSLGAQTFNDETLKKLNRSHSAEDILKSYHLLEKAGFQNINMDFILSLPGETLEDIKDSLQKAVDLGARHISLYELTIEEKTVFGSQHKKGKLLLPNEETQTTLLTFARDFLKQNGFLHYELLNYAKPGSQSRHNLLYWANEEYLGLGPGAFSYFAGRRFRSSASVEEYFTKMKNNDWSAHEEEVLSHDKKEIESLLLALRLTEGADTVRFRSVLSKLRAPIDDLQEKGLLIQDLQSVRLSPRGQFLAETVFAELASL